jgi:hypothetical protein
MDNAKIMALFSKSKVDMAREQDLMASSQERMAKIQDIFASAEHKSTQSDLDLVKMMVELEDMQFMQFKNAFEYAQAVKLANKEEQMATSAI